MVMDLIIFSLRILDALCVYKKCVIYTETLSRAKRKKSQLQKKKKNVSDKKNVSRES